MPALRISRNAGLAILDRRRARDRVAHRRQRVRRIHRRRQPGSGSRDDSARRCDAPDAQWRARLARNPTDFPALVILALNLEQQGKTAEAGDAMREAMRLAPAERDHAAPGGRVFHLRNGEEPQALAILRRAVELNPDGRRRRVADTSPRPSTAAGTTISSPAPRATTRNGGRGSSTTRAGQRPTSAPSSASLPCAPPRATCHRRRTPCIIDRLEREVAGRSAYQSWINSLPREQQQRIGYVFNGDFESPISNVGFDWIVAAAGRRERRRAIDPGRGRPAGAADRVRPQAMERALLSSSI